ncbi:MarR family winged helix-turn-helix transcriptional regulator [Amycolatopsis jiangsuensis]|uniref:DNA-binding MarR family transcriptional regulator n=1 Tax=Amycolatopsis jiangsuensis TaxID=1181879 RepID=A0A840ITM5_9PSEU|nr:MarR family transcriptional regulator [Amycolatopsis jiangsuensis]MBB4684717.1 DNA-binding MarR family transcriptional regulator [Amycolatopsis jiangsuensis]
MTACWLITVGLLAYLKRAEQATQQAKEQVLRDYGITPAQQAALTIVSEHEGISSAELARQCQVTRQTMNSTVGRLEARGLIQRTPHPMHRTLIELTLTGYGRDLFERADARVSALDTDLAAELSPAELSTLKDLLTRVTDHAPRAATHKFEQPPAKTP